MRNESSLLNSMLTFTMHSRNFLLKFISKNGCSGLKMLDCLKSISSRYIFYQWRRFILGGGAGNESEPTRFFWTKKRVLFFNLTLFVLWLRLICALNKILPPNIINFWEHARVACENFRLYINLCHDWGRPYICSLNKFLPRKYSILGHMRG